MSIGQAAQLSKNIPQHIDKKGDSLLLDLKPGVESKITGIKTKDASIIKKMMAMGVLPGMSVTIIRKFPSVVFKVGNTTMAVDKAIAKCIEVKE
ncbi:MAG: ferrous iron transport protein A [Firmicutes bacterium]|nr:ferrous iron transport protein A [Bacillota bacterium]